MITGLQLAIIGGGLVGLGIAMLVWRLAPADPDLGCDLHCLPGPGAGVAFQGNEIDVGAQCSGEVSACLLGVVAGVVVRQEEHQNSEADRGCGRDQDRECQPHDGEEAGEQRRDEQAEKGEQDLLAVETGQRDPKDGELSDRYARPRGGREGLHRPPPEAFPAVRGALGRLGGPAGVFG